MKNEGITIKEINEFLEEKTSWICKKIKDKFIVYDSSTEYEDLKKNEYHCRGWHY